MTEKMNRPGEVVGKYNLVQLRINQTSGKVVGLDLPAELTGNTDAHLKLEEGEDFAQLTKEGIIDLANEGKLTMGEAKKIINNMSGLKASFIVDEDGSYTLLQRHQRFLDIKNR